MKSNKPSHIDLPEYKTSSNIVQPDFENFTWYIVTEFFDNEAAYDFEQRLIYERWTHPLLLNKTCYITTNLDLDAQRVFAVQNRQKEK